jgi:hypothetical protein
MGSTECETGYCMGVGGKTTGWPVGRGRVRWESVEGMIPLERGSTAPPLIVT